MYRDCPGFEALELFRIRLLLVSFAQRYSARAPVEWIIQNGPVITIVGALVTILVTFFNIAMAVRTARIANRQLEISSQQYHKQWRPSLHAQAISHAAFPFALELTNLGKADSRVTEILVRRSGIQSAAIERFLLDRVIPAGNAIVLPVTRELREYLEIHKPGSAKTDALDFSFAVQVAGEQFTTEWFRFLVALEGGVPRRLESGEEHRRLP